MTDKVTAAETHPFQTEVQQLLHLMIHALYSHKEIFLRELISNASDACDKLRFASLTDKSLLEDRGELEIQVSVDSKARTITVTDNGIGMSHDDVVRDLGTIARSGTKHFVEAMTGEDSKDARLIGQFGVGFYSVFMVAEEVTVNTRKAGLPASEGVRWHSDGSGEFTVETLERAEGGTEIVVKVRKEDKEFLDGHRLRSIIRKYSDHISLPIRMPKEEEEVKEEESADETDGWETVNRGSALWARPRSEITEEDYNQFYSTLAYDPEPPLAVVHNHVEGKLEYTSLLFIPSRAPFDLWDRDSRHGVKLYVRRIFIMDDARYLMPSYLRFVRGIVDSADLPLNVSREFLQHNREIDRIRSGSVKKVLTELKRMADKEPEKYGKFWDQFGQVLKEGIVEDTDNRERIAALLRFASTKSEEGKQEVSLDEYIKRMPVKQDAIYYLTADSHQAAKDSPHLEVFRKRGIEVLLMSDPVDEWVVTHLGAYQDKQLKSVAKGQLDLEEEDAETGREDLEKKKEEYNDVVNGIREALGERVKDVRVTNRLTDSPACLVADENDMGANLERILRAVGQKAPESKPILEINPDHTLIRNLQSDRSRIDDWAHVLFDQAALSEGAPLAEPAAYVRRVNELLGRAVLAGR